MDFTESENSNGTNSSFNSYDYDPNSFVLPVEELVPVTIVYGITLILGLIGNILVILSVARYRKMQNVTNIFLLSLASADLLLVIVCVPVKCVAFFSFSWKLGEVLCKLVNYLQNVSIMCSVMNLTGLSLERYYAILHPMKAKYVCTIKLARRTVILIWVMGLILASPTLAGQVHKPVGVHIDAYWCILEWDSGVIQRLYGVFMYMVILVIPLILLTFAYTSICWRLWLIDSQFTRHCHNTGNVNLSEFSFLRPCTERNKNNSGNNSVQCKISLRGKAYNQDENGTRKQVVKMLFAIVVLFVVCWGPIMTNNLLVAFDIIDYLHSGNLKPIRQALMVLSYFNSCINPVVYGFMSKNFRKAFLSTLGIVCKQNDGDVYGNRSIVRFSLHTRSSYTPSSHPRSLNLGSNDRSHIPSKSMTDPESQAAGISCDIDTLDSGRVCDLGENGQI